MVFVSNSILLQFQIRIEERLEALASLVPDYRTVFESNSITLQFQIRTEERLEALASLVSVHRTVFESNGIPLQFFTKEIFFNGMGNYF
jgi:hypothetical protein